MTTRLSVLGITGHPLGDTSGKVPNVTAALTGTVIGANEDEIRAGGKTIVLTLTNDTWVASGATFNAQRQNIIDGLDSAQSETTGWNAEVRDKEAVTAVARTSDTVVTITLSEAANYDITAAETITATIPATALTTSSVAVVASPTFSVSVVADTGADTHDGGPVVYDEEFYLRARKDLDRLKRERRRLRRLIKETVSPVSEQPTARETVPTPESRAEPFLYENKLADIEARIAELGQLIAEIKRLQAEEDELVEILLLAA